jgi:cyclopropane fatty-acyl-phospholipid synthase-like methyltransferase
VNVLKSDMDQSNGWESIADNFIANRNSSIGVKTLETWLKSLSPGATVLDLGCGFGVPNTEILQNAGFNVYGIDASQTLINEIRRRSPRVTVSCEAAENSNLFNLKFDGVIAIGLMFLLSEKAQLKVLQNVSIALSPHGKFLFTAPFQACTWNDVLTNRKSRSLGKEVYVGQLSRQGLALAGEYSDEGDNHYFDFIKR